MRSEERKDSQLSAEQRQGLREKCNVPNPLRRAVVVAAVEAEHQALIPVRVVEAKAREPHRVNRGVGEKLLKTSQQRRPPKAKMLRAAGIHCLSHPHVHRNRKNERLSSMSIIRKMSLLARRRWSGDRQAHGADLTQISSGGRQAPRGPLVRGEAQAEGQGTRPGPQHQLQLICHDCRHLDSEPGLGHPGPQLANPEHPEAQLASPIRVVPLQRLGWMLTSRPDDLPGQQALLLSAHSLPVTPAKRMIFSL